MAGTGPSTWGLRRGRGVAECLKAKAHQKWSLYRPSARLRAGDGHQDGQRGKLDGIAAGGIGGVRASAGGGTFGASTRQERREGWLGGQEPLRGNTASSGEGDPMAPSTVVRMTCRDENRATHADCDCFCDFAGFLILAVRPPLIPWGGIANYG
jgi:hypothetical protein